MKEDLGPQHATVIRRLPKTREETAQKKLLEREWLVTNGLGGYASGTVAGANTRKYHGMLVAALPAPLGRIVMWSQLLEFLHFDDRVVSLSGGEFLSEFRLEDGLPVWIFRVEKWEIEKRVIVPHLQNTVHVTYRISGANARPMLELRPAFQFRHHETEVDKPTGAANKIRVAEERCEITPADERFPPFRMRVQGGAAEFVRAETRVAPVIYPVERARGYPFAGELWSPGAFRVHLTGDACTTLIGSTDDWQIVDASTPEAALNSERERRARLLANAAPPAREGVAAELVFAADQFIITPAGRPEETARAHAIGDGVRTVIAGYHWFTDWGRDTMIALEGLTLSTGRSLEAGYILRTFAHYVRDGLIPNMFPDGQHQGLYHTADATLWFFHALGRYVQQSDDRMTLRLLLPTLVDIAEHHLRGTKFNIHVDPADGLLVQGEEGYQLTWMDAKMGDWVVTPRRGKAVEINALWYNALKLLASWLRDLGENALAARYENEAERMRISFNHRFWLEKGGYLFDVVDTAEGDDASCRPNQIFAISLDHPVLDERRWPAVLEVVERELLTPFGLRSLSPKDDAYRGVCDGDLRTRDAAYHQGTVWGWLIGPFVDAWLKLHPGETKRARQFLEKFPAHLSEAGLGTVSEIFDGDEPHAPRACIAQAWSVAEVLRCWKKTAN